jgi:hypothetical protein
VSRGYKAFFKFLRSYSVLAATLGTTDRGLFRIFLEHKAARLTQEKDLTLVNVFHNTISTAYIPYKAFGEQPHNAYGRLKYYKGISQI